MTSDAKNKRPPQGSTEWWVLYPFIGLDLLAEKFDLESPIFGDATIVSKLHVDDLANLVIRSGDPDSEKNRREIRDLIASEQLIGDFHSFVAVRRFGSKDISDHDAITRLQSAAEARAKRIAACLSLSVLAESRSLRTCTLADLVGEHKRGVFTISKSGGLSITYGLIGSSASIRQDRDTIRLTRSGLSDLLQRPRLEHFTSLLLEPQVSISRSLNRAISEAAIRLSEAIQAHDTAGQVLGSITSIEILISDFGGSFDRIKSRLRELIGLESFEALECESVFRARHQYVHRGRAPENSALAIGIALHAILAYSSLAVSIPSRSQLIDYLDFIAAGRRSHSTFTAEEVTAFETIRRHNPSSISFEWLNVQPEPAGQLKGQT